MGKMLIYAMTIRVNNIECQLSINGVYYVTIETKLLKQTHNKYCPLQMPKAVMSNIYNS